MASVCGANAQVPQAGSPVRVKKPFATLSLAALRLQKPKNITDKELGAALAAHGDLALIGFDPNFHIAYLDGDSAIIYRHEQIGDFTYRLHVYQISLKSRTISQQITVPFQNIMEQDGGRDGNTQVHVAGAFLLIRANSSIISLNKETFAKISEYLIKTGGPPTYYLVNKDTLSLRLRSAPDEIYDWLSVPELKTIRSFRITSPAYDAMASPAESFVLRRDVIYQEGGGGANGIEAYFNDGTSKQLCTEMLCQQGVAHLEGNSFLLYGRSGFGVLQVSADPSSTRITNRHTLPFKCQSEFTSPDSQSMIVGVTVSGCPNFSGPMESSFFSLVTGNEVGVISYDAKPGWHEVALDHGGSIVGVIDNETLRLFKLAP